MNTLGQFVGGRDNNFNLLRFTAAFLVLFSHSFVLSTGDPLSEPLQARLGMNPGAIAVDIFFITSGFLVTGSLWARASIGQFVLARVLRIYPALIVAVLLTVLVVGLFFTHWPLVRYLNSAMTWEYVARNLTLVFGVAYQLPGAFETLPFKAAVNGSLWTLPYEVRMYGLLALLWIGVRLSRPGLHKSFGAMVIAVAAVGLLANFALHGTGWGTAARLLYMFFIGAALYVLRDRIPTSWAAFLVGLVAVLAASAVPTLFFPIYTLALPYLVMFFAFVPAGPIRQFNRLGDYSYGLYIYAFPVQQATMALLPRSEQPALLVISSVVSLAFAIASWHLIEKRALAMKDASWELLRNVGRRAG